MLPFDSTPEESPHPEEISEPLPQSPRDHSAAIEILLESEDRFRSNQGRFANLDLLLAVKSIPAILITETLQSELQADPSLGQFSSPFTLIAEAPWDWKATGVAVGAFAITSAAGRIKKHLTFRRDAINALKDVAEAVEYRPATDSEVRRRRLFEKCGRGLLTLAGCTVAYKAGEHGSLGQDLVAQSALIAGAIASVGITKWRAKNPIIALRHRQIPG